MSNNSNKKELKPGGLLANITITIENEFIRYRGAYGDQAIVPINQLTTITISPNGFGKSDLVFLGDKVELARVKKLPTQWAEKSMLWLISELKLGTNTCVDNQTPPTTETIDTEQITTTNPSLHTQTTNNTKWYSSTGFVILMLVVFFPVGLFLMWKEKKFNQWVRIAVTAIFAIAIISGASDDSSSKNSVDTKQATVQASTQEQAKPSTIQSSEETQKDLKTQQNAFTGWETRFMSKTRAYDEVWKTWDLTAQGLSNGQLNVGQAYNLLSKLENALGNIQSEFYTMDVPSELSGEHKKLLKEAVEAMGTATYCRRDGVKHFLKYMDDNKPSSYSKAVDRVKSSNDHVMSAAFKVGQVKAELGLTKDNQ